MKSCIIITVMLLLYVNKYFIPTRASFKGWKRTYHNLSLVLFWILSIDIIYNILRFVWIRQNVNTVAVIVILFFRQQIAVKENFVRMTNNTITYFFIKRIHLIFETFDSNFFIVQGYEILWKDAMFHILWKDLKL